jgi:O-antigen/teichoic acid export membrane protein
VRSGEVAYNVSRGAFWLGLEKLAALLSGVAYSMFVSRWLGTSRFGVITLAIACVGFATAATGNFEMFLERFAAEYEARGQRATLRRVHLMALALKTGLGLLAGAALFALVPRITDFYAVAAAGAAIPPSELSLILRLLTLTVVFDGLSTTGRATLYGTQQFRWVALPAVLFHVAKTLMVGLMWWSHGDLPALALGLMLLAAGLAVAQGAAPLWILRRVADREPPPEAERTRRGLLRGMFAYCMPLLGGRITFMSGQNLSKMILGKLFDPSLLGLFTFAYQTMERFNDLVSTVPSSLLPSFTRLVATNERVRLRQVLDDSQRLVQAIGCVVAIGVFVFAREITLFLGSALFEPAVPFLRVLALVPLARTAQQPLTMVFQALRRPGTVLALALIKFVTEFGCYVLLVLPFGIMGAAWSNLAGAVVSYVSALALLARLVPEGASSRAHASLRAAGLLVPLVALTLVLDRWLHDPWLLGVVHVALLVPAGIGVFRLGLVRREDVERLERVPLERPWTRVVRGSVVMALGLFDRLAHVERA